MLLGREWYQGGKKELIVVWGSLGVHLLSGVLKRISKTARVYRLRQGRHLSAKQETIESKQVDAKLHKSLSYTPSLQARTGYLLVPIVAIHSLTHRVWPASSKAPYKGLSPSLLSYNFVSYSLQNYTISSIVGYGSLILLATYHFTSGRGRLPTSRRLRLTYAR
ncbi:hypothetical protein E5Q_02674 [Mixia osmundae IAM 14324]|uniref:Mitochondrial adapter protein MCP1 transmembrane domain-containing protein n=1 Tax=Mixia osmundae (strain CBS 9802 / IAM 14324 / JCM 22182 / KY 12970) TaxID=764103 RepID=G7DZK4_MIXOS|nr:hypothetical protein E5Q_02674 [Mixia osmundae IAM 14324]